ncbi:type IV pilus assembly protein PilM [Singulisphaera sp. Ch08]|uniref:Type IV pilus assembly protein PilM n=1 Tax=Singulisphaera sp. Ch08 TaxID=3120278 RepID=A0AAU7CPX1_9BACT
MAKIQAVWALDVGQAALKALKLVPGETPDHVVAEAFDYVEYPKILSQPDADPDQLVREALETFLERNDLKGCKVAISVPGQAGLVKFIKLPPVEKKRIPDIVKFEARQQIPFALEEVVWAYQQIGDDDGESDEDFTMAEVGLFAMKRDQINRAILPFRVCGIEVDIVQMGPIALYNYITFDQIKEGPPPAFPGAEPAGDAPETEAGEAKPPAKAGGDKGSIVLIDIGADNTDLIITDGVRIWQRNVPIGGNHFTRALTKELKLTFAKAEHLKRNATKAPDPRSIFTAMRGVFNDFASEINRSIGFYGSVNRNSKISKVVGLGNGFKLPGLQKFLQQNLSHEVEKLESFIRLAGDDVKTSPQFQENLPSFGVVYGLALQGLAKSPIRTNLLPPEIEKIRIIRAKKPWALAASALLMLGFSALFLGDYRVLAKVDTQPFDEAVKQAQNTTNKGSGFASEFEAAKTEWKTKFDEGDKLVAGTTDRAKWPDFLKILNEHLPDPVRDYKLDPNKPADQLRLDHLRVHIDAIKPAWREDLDTEWFNAPPPKELSRFAKDLMHQLDRTTPPTGAGWVIQVIGHHYNPDPTLKERQIDESSPLRTDFGPYQFIIKKILPKLNAADLRLYGIHHPTLAWALQDPEWTNEKASMTNGLASTTIPILDRAKPAVVATEGGEGMMGGMMPGMMPGMGGGEGMMPGMGGNDMMMPGMMPGMPGMMGGGYGGLAGKEAKKLVKHNRTDFLIQFVWQEPKPEDVPKTPEERMTKLQEISKSLREAETNKTMITAEREKEIEKESLKQSQVVQKAMIQGAAAAASATATPAGPTAPAAPGAPAATPATPK